MPAAPIQYWHRAKKTVEAEQVYGERWLRLAYENPVGRFAVWLLVRRAAFSHFYGWRMNRPFSVTKVFPFIVAYDIDVDEFAKSAFTFKTFNEFFYRALKPGARPIAPGEDVAVLPADGRHLVFPDVERADGFYVKGASFTLAELLGEAGQPPEKQVLASRFAGGAMLISRLAPMDCHRFHFPVGGRAGTPQLIRGTLYSVHPIALRRHLRYLVENRRMVTLVESATFGTVAMVEVGATAVGRIRQTFIPDRSVAKGEEKGLFAFGGSCVITLFSRGHIQFDDDLVAQSAQHRETYAKMGDRLGAAVAAI
ncbi:MAG TPA: phosphatidylserine decarboxylase [Opitutaceae bacterium]|nr:phosphatidylserine decarboxylase [Opitutaceae bacterium]